MPTVYRICKTKFAATIFDGEGAFRFGGRWNSRGTRLIYAASSLSLATLEIVVNLEDDALIPAYSYAVAEVDPGLIMPVEDFRALPANWNSSPSPPEVQQIGDDWAHTLASAVLEVPTSVVPREKNYLLNPAHPDFGRITLGAAESFPFDERLVRPSTMGRKK